MQCQLIICPIPAAIKSAAMSRGRRVDRIESYEVVVGDDLADRIRCGQAGALGERLSRGLVAVAWLEVIEMLTEPIRDKTPASPKLQGAVHRPPGTISKMNVPTWFDEADTEEPATALIR
jgi:hypothetical protein